ncbi:unnamed protein product [Didymodactylos carnosus]|uniref:Reverse transcriptase domain-containing protein n=1 Tax=Didymodactylos carnosus TaxID=1234261 RepID=A0A8S2WC03_9BILA|nr:unnamed protein product [Didymodactylos carnosus]CAF4255733.1 unnamed protein product [Didymodactylos carnosus]CAF4426132.1 unnamed protein product [Didymodactylos carnosus]
MQFGFRPKSPTTDALLHITIKLSEILEQKKVAIGVAFDFAKAFDGVSHSVLLKKLHKAHVHGSVLEWFESYLTDREQIVIINKAKSKAVKVASGVSQGSILDPLLFLIFINDLSQGFPPTITASLVADDVFGLIPLDNFSDFIEVQNFLNVTADWCVKNGISFNIKKRFFMPFSNNKLPTQYPPLYLSGEPLLLDSNIKLLGVHLSHDLTWKFHIDNIAKRCRQMLDAMNRTFRCAPTFIRLHIYKTCILPVLAYSCIVFDNDFKTHLSPLTSVHKLAARMITNNFFANSSDLIQQLKLPDLEKRRKYFR